MATKNVMRVIWAAALIALAAGCGGCRQGGAKSEDGGEVRVESSYTMDDLCDRLAQEMRFALAGEDAINASKISCKKTATKFKGSKDEVSEYVGQIMTMCGMKSGQEWIKCYANEAPSASRVAANKKLR